MTRSELKDAFNGFTQGLGCLVLVIALLVLILGGSVHVTINWHSLVELIERFKIY